MIIYIYIYLIGVRAWSNHRISWYATWPWRHGLAMRAEPPRFMACMRLLRGIELDHVQELMQVPAHFWRLYLGGGGKVWLDSDVEMRLYRVRAVSVYCWSWSEDYRVERWKHRYNCQLMRRDQFCQFSACYSRGSSGSVAFSTGASRLVRPPFAAQSLHMFFEFIWRLL